MLTILTVSVMRSLSQDGSWVVLNLECSVPGPGTGPFPRFPLRWYVKKTGKKRFKKPLTLTRNGFFTGFLGGFFRGLPRGVNGFKGGFKTGFFYPGF